jgi:hypothetical protein
MLRKCVEGDIYNDGIYGVQGKFDLGRNVMMCKVSLLEVFGE